MNLGFIGTGNVGATLAKKLGQKGHSVFLGSRAPTKLAMKDLVASIGPTAQALTMQQAVDHSDIIFLATPWDVTEEVITKLEHLSGKIIIDCTNPIKRDLSGLSVGLTSSGGELVQSWAEKAKVVKAFNTVGFNIMANPIIEGRRSILYFCGDCADSKIKVQHIIQELDFDPIDAGPLSTARLLEPFALLWINSAYKFGLGRDFAFCILRKNS